MALAGLKKQFNKANQYMNEKIGGVEGTKFTDEFTQLERRTDLTYELVDELINRTKEYLQPNPASRTKLMVSSKLKGAPGKPHSYPQPEGILADAMCKYGKEVNDDSNFAKSLAEMGEALREMAEVKYALEDNVKQNFLEPLTHLQAKDLKDVLFHRKKLEGRRLDYDCKKRKRQKGTHFSEDEIRMAEEKLEESYNLASMGMHNLLQNEIEQLSQICVLSEALYEYHSQCANILESLNARLMEIKNGAAQRTFQPYIPKKLHELNLNVTSIGHDDLSPGDAQMMNARTPTDSRGPCCQALYDFDAENENEISFKEGDIIQLVTQVDENWYEGSVNGRTGLFPVSYVQVLVPINNNNNNNNNSNNNNQPN
ncbi:endophilin-a-like protein [Dermatophagoides farinae]|uniref:Endophilin-A n=1 Tax=Dermatophagoides farinae TaxID=6954 RepID=A0A9D4P9D4_DERFA|nr:endophilin-A-like isoform X5 [Dermatophagoides farinae]KAH7646473.1 endophilin-a-like protein [Dermatophagoides farinae]